MKYYCLAISILLSSAVQAQEVVSLTFQEAVNQGLKNNVTVKQEENNLILNDAQQRASLVNYLPVLPNMNLRASSGTFQGNNFIQQTGQVVTGVTNFLDGEFQASTTLFQGFNRYYTYKQQNRAVDAQVYNVKWTKETVIGNVASQYLDCLLNEELLTIAENNLKLQQEQLNKIDEQVRLGSLALVDRINQEYQVKNAEVGVIRAQITLRNSIAQLSQLLQLNPTSKINLIEPDWTLQVLMDEDKNVEELVDVAMENRADIKQAVEMEEAAAYQVKANRGRYYPSLTGFYNYSSAYNNVQGEVDRSFEQQFTEDNVQQFYGISLNIPILNGLQSRVNVVQSKVAYENRKLTNENLVNTAKIEVINAYQDYQEALASYNATNSQLDAAKLSFSLEEERFNLGASDLVQLTEANQNYVQAQADYAQSFYTLAFQDILLKYALGTLTLEDIPE